MPTAPLPTVGSVPTVPTVPAEALPPPLDEPFGTPTYHHVVGGPAPGGSTRRAARGGLPRTVARRGVQGARYVTRRVISASEADGARESGLTALIWNQVLSYGTDAMITVALAGTVFFGASAHAQRGNVLLYLLVTMAPFAVVAPVIGPALDRVQHGRRWAMAASAIGRAVLALIMAGHPSDLFVLYPCALGSLVFSKAYSVIRGAAAPRLVPPGMTLVEANARLSVFGLGAALLGGGFVGVLIKASGSYTFGLVVTAIAFGVCAYSAFRLPKMVDSASPAAGLRVSRMRPATSAHLGLLPRLAQWARRGFAGTVITSLQGVSTLRFLSGFLAIFLAFHIEARTHGFAAVLDLGAVGAAAGAGNFAGTGIGSRLKMNRPELLVMICTAAAAAATAVGAALFSLTIAVAAVFVCAVGNSLAKVALDAVIQRDVAEVLRSSAFARSEAFLQLAWVVGAAAACLMPPHQPTVAFAVVGGLAVVLTVVVVLRHRAMSRMAMSATSAIQWHPPPGNVAP